MVWFPRKSVAAPIIKQSGFRRKTGEFSACNAAGIAHVPPSQSVQKPLSVLIFRRFCGTISMSAAAMPVAVKTIYSLYMEIYTMESKMAKMPVTQESLAAIVARRYQVDAGFRAEFDKDPKAAVSRITGLKMPTGSEIVVHRNEDKHWHISLPSAARTSELKDEDISSVSGGARYEPTWSDLWGRPDPEAEREMDQFMNHHLPDLMRSVGAIGP